MNLTEKIKKYAHKLGFDLVGIVPAGKSQTIDFYEDWLARGFDGEMGYLRRHLDKKRDPRSLLDSAKTIICLGMNYFSTIRSPVAKACPRAKRRVVDGSGRIPSFPKELKNDPSRGIISCYAWGLDYHDVVRQKLRQLKKFIDFALRSKIDAKICVDTAPILEREFASRAGLGWIGKNCNLINPKYGSWLFLAELILKKELVYDQVEVKDRCGTCTRCIDACPTGALIAPRVLDSRRCISYLTIEHKGIIPHELRSAMGNRIFGCDVCQEVCPWNHHVKRKEQEVFTTSPLYPKLLDLMLLTDAEFRNLFKNSPIERTKRRGLLRNVAIAIGNWADQTVNGACCPQRSTLLIPTLMKALNDPEPLIRHHVAWALERENIRIIRKSSRIKIRV